MQTNKLFLAVAALSALLQSSLTAQVITPVSASASSFYSAGQDPVNLINGSGLAPGSGDVLTNTANAQGSAGGMWHSNGSTVSNTWVAFDLGADNFTVTNMAIWQMNQPGNLGRGVKTFAVYTASTTNVTDATNFVGNFSLGIGLGANGEPVQRLAMSATGVRLIKFAILTDWNGFVNDYVGLAEVRFEGFIPQVTITAQPSNSTNLLGESHTFSVTASGPAPLRYQWYKSPATLISGATNATYPVGLVTAGNVGSYYVIVTNSTSAATSSVVSLTLLTNSAIIPIAATASSFFSGQQNPINLINGNGQAGLTNEIYNQTANAQGSANGMWHTDGTAVNGAWVAFDLGAQGSLTAAHIWQMNQPGSLGRGVHNFAIYTSATTNQADATNLIGNFSLNIAGGVNGEPVQSIPLSAGGVRLVKFVITDDWNGADPDYVGLAEVRFEGNIPFTIISPPANTTNLLGESHTFAVTAAGVPPLSYQWYQSPNTPISGATNSSYSVGLITAGSAAGYYAVVTNSSGSLTSSVATMTVLNTYAVTPVAATASSFYDAGHTPANLISSFGQSGPNEIFNQTANADNGATGMWHSDGTAVNGAWVAFDLGSQFTLSSADIWQMNQGNNIGRGVKDFSIYTSGTTNINDATNFVGNFSLAQGGGVNGEPVQRLPLSLSNVRLVKFLITDDWNGADPDYVGLSEVRFEGTAPCAIASQPQPPTNFLTETHTLSAPAAGSTPIFYQWYIASGGAIPNATNANVTVGPILSTNVVGYYVVASNSFNAATSSVASVTVLNAYPLRPLGATASSSSDLLHTPDDIVNGNGQLGPNELLYQTADLDVGNVTWHSDGTAVNGAWVAFNLGAQYTVSSVDIWQLNSAASPGIGVHNFAIYTSTDANDANATNFVGNFALNIGGGVAGEPVQRIPIFASNVRLVKFVIADNWNGTDPDTVALSEVRFEVQALSPIINTFGVTGGGGTLSLSAQGGIGNGPWTLLQSTNLTTPLSQWQIVTNGVFDGFGNVSMSGVSTGNGGRAFFILKTQ